MIKKKGGQGISLADTYRRTTLNYVVIPYIDFDAKHDVLLLKFECKNCIIAYLNSIILILNSAKIALNSAKIALCYASVDTFYIPRYYSSYTEHMKGEV